jgi:hypothetical protein
MDDDIEQYSAASADALRRRTDALIDGLREHADALIAARRGAAWTQRLFDHNDTIEALVEAWNEAVFDDTGTTPLLLADVDEQEDDEDDDYGEVPEDGVLSIVTRVDLSVADPATLLDAGRAAYRRLWADETEEDAEAAVDGVTQAVYTVAHEAGEPLFDIPGAELVSAARVYVVAEPPFEPPGDLGDDPEAMLGQVVPPRGTLVFSESWV